MRGDSSGSRARADNRTNYGKLVQSQPDTDAGGDIPERECDNATPVFILHDHIPTRNGMKSGVPPMWLLNSFAVSRKTWACVFRHVLCLPRSEAPVCAVGCRMKLSSHVIQRRVGRVTQL
jgi:hypothetical protein